MRCESRQAESARQRGADRIILWIGVDKSGDNMPPHGRDAANQPRCRAAQGIKKGRRRVASPFRLVNRVARRPGAPHPPRWINRNR